MKRAAIFVGCSSFFFAYRPPETRSHPAFFQSPLTAKLTAKPVDNRGFSWMTVDIRLASGADGRHWWMAKNKKCRRGDSLGLVCRRLLVSSSCFFPHVVVLLLVGMFAVFPGLCCPALP